MVGRVSAFADPEIIKMATRDFVPVCADDWYQRRRDDAEGKFFLAAADQARKSPNGGTRQGIYTLTADGTVLAYKNAGNSADVTREQLKTALAKFRRLPADRRAPGAVTVPDHGPVDPKYGRSPPDGGLIVRTHARILDERDGAYCKGTCEFTGGASASRDFLWLTAADVRTLAPADPTVGARYPVPPDVAERVLRFHLVDNTRGEPPFWARDQIRRSELVLTVMAAGPDAVDLRLDGTALLATDPDPAEARRGYEVRLRGELRYRPKVGTFDRLEIAAVGEHWGEGAYTERGAAGAIDTRSGVPPGRSGPPGRPRDPARGPLAGRLPTARFADPAGCRCRIRETFPGSGGDDCSPQGVAFAAAQSIAATR